MGVMGLCGMSRECRLASGPCPCMSVVVDFMLCYVWRPCGGRAREEASCEGWVRCRE
jgi:hypothetical protein